MSALNTESMIGERFTIGRNEYEVTRVDTMEGLENSKKRLIESGKLPITFFAGKVLKSGKVSSKQGGMFYKFNSGGFLKVF